MLEFPESEVLFFNDVAIEVFQAGEGGHPIVLAHGWPEHAFSWRYQVPALVDAGYHVIIPNQRGYGLSSQPSEIEQYDCVRLTGDFNSLLDYLGFDQAIFVGHDWGAILVWQHALLNPERVMAVANLSVPFRPREKSDPVMFWEKMLGPDFYIVHFNRQPEVAARAFESDVRAFLRNMYRTEQWKEKGSETIAPENRSIIDSLNITNPRGKLMMSEPELQVFVDSFERSGFVAPCNWYRNFTRNWEIMSDVEEKVRVPALMIYGKYDMVPKTSMDGYVEDLEIHTLECGHWIQQERPEETNRILVDWLERRVTPLLSNKIGNL